MPRFHAIELLPDEGGADVVRRGWQALRDAGLPSMLDHTGASNTPHVTVIASPTITAEDEQLAASLIQPLLPLAVTLTGLVVFGGERVTLARLVEVPDELVSAVLRLRAETGGHPHSGWLPHATLGRRIPRGRLQEAAEGVGHVTEPFLLTSIRRWDPEANAVRPLVTRD